jgi:hypothetical protein
MAAFIKDGMTAIQHKNSALQRSATGTVSSANEDNFQWRSVCHTVVPELLQGAHTKKMLNANEGLPSIADQVLTTSLASIMRVSQKNSSLGGIVNVTSAIPEQSSAIETLDFPSDTVSSITPPLDSVQSLKSRSPHVAASKTVGMLTKVRARMIQNVVANYSKEEQLRQSNLKIEELQAHIKSLNVLLAAKESSRVNAAAIASVDCTPHASSAGERAPASNNSAVHTAMVMRMEQLECSRDELKRQLVAFQEFNPVYKEILTILGQAEGRKTAAQIVRNIEQLLDHQRISSQHILELQEKVEISESESKTTMRQKHVELAAKESELVNLKNQFEQQKVTMFQIVRQKDEATERRMELESMMLQLKISLKLLAESWGCDTSLVTEAEAFVALLSQTMIGKSSAQDSLQVIQGVINTTWMEILHARYPGAQLPGDAISGIRLMYDSIKALNLQNAQLSKHLKEAKKIAAEKQEELDKWKRTKASVMSLASRFFCLIKRSQLSASSVVHSFVTSFLQELAHDRKVLELHGCIRKDVQSQTDNQEEIGERPPRSSHSAHGIAKLAPLPSTPAQAHAIKVPAFQMLSEDKANAVLGPPKWKRQLIAKARM